MAGRDMLMQVVVKLRDELSRGIDGAMKKLTALGNLTKRISTASVAALNAIGTKLGMLGIGIGGGATAALDSLLKYDDALRQSAVIVGKSGKEAEDWIKKHGVAWQATSKVVKQTSDDLAGSQKDLLGALGTDAEAVVDRMVVQVGRAATASSASVKDITTTAKVMYQNMGVQPDEMYGELARLFVAGNLGNFELKDMAQYYPEIAPNLGTLGLKGKEGNATFGALSQISKMGAGTPGEAATNLKDFLNQLTAPHFKKRMEDHGVDVDGVLKDAAIKNINPLEAMIQKVLKVTGAGDAAKKAAAEAKAKGLSPGDSQKLIEDRVTKAISASKLGEVLINQQGKTFFATLQMHLEEYRAIKKKTLNADTGEMDAAFDTMAAGPLIKRRMAGESIEQLGRRFAAALTGAFEKVDWMAQQILRLVAALDEVSPKIVDLASQFTALVSAVAGATLVLRMFGGAAPAPAAATAGAGVAGAAAGAAGAGGAGGLLGRLLGAARVGTGLGLGAFVAWKTWQGLDAIGEAAGSKNWTPKAPDEMADLRARLKATEATIAKLRTNSRDPDSLGPVLAPHEARAADLRGRIAAGERAGVERPLQPLPRPSVQAPPQKVEIGGNITVKVDGPGKVTSASSSTPGVTIGGGSDRGSNGSRP